MDNSQDPSLSNNIGLQIKETLYRYQAMAAEWCITWEEIVCWGGIC